MLAADAALVLAFALSSTASSVIAGALSGGGLSFAAWRLFPSQRRALDASATRDAVETVEVALNAARGRIEALERRTASMTEKIGELRGRLEHESAERVRIHAELDLSLAERAQLQQQIASLNRWLGTRRIEDLVGAGSPPDAIVISDLRTGRISYVSEGVYALLDYTPAQLIGCSIDVLVPEADRAKHGGDRAKFAEDPQARGMGKRVADGVPLAARKRDGSTVLVDISLHPTGDERVIALLKRR